MRVSRGVAGSALLLLAACGDARVVVDDRRLAEADADTANWLTYGRTLDEQRFSPLTAVNEATVKEG